MDELSSQYNGAGNFCFVATSGGGEFGVVGTEDRANTGSIGIGPGDQNSSVTRFVIEWDGTNHTSHFNYVKISKVELSTVCEGSTRIIVSSLDDSVPSIK